MERCTGEERRRVLVLIGAHRSDLVRVGPAGWDVRDGNSREKNFWFELL